MLKIIKQKKGFASIVEVIVTSIVFSVAAISIFATISMVRPQSSSASQQLEAAYIGRQVMDELRGKIDANTWNDSGSDYAVDVIHTKNYGVYTVNYLLTDDPNLDVRRLSLNVYY